MNYLPGTRIVNPFNPNGTGLQFPSLKDERYKDMDGWFTPEQANLYYKVISEAEDPTCIVEIGAYKGKSTSFAAAAIKELNKAGIVRFVTIDSFKGTLNEPEHQEVVASLGGSLREAFNENLKGLLNYVEVIEGDSAQSATLFKDGSCDLVFIDGDHSIDGVIRDILSWKVKVKQTGTLAGDDYHTCWGVFPAVNNMLGTTNILIDNQTWIYDGKLQT